ncbi:hypothetical protein IKO18_03660 [bacterium]|nr:hypothetical protein [bacterium]
MDKLLHDHLVQIRFFVILKNTIRILQLAGLIYCAFIIVKQLISNSVMSEIDLRIPSFLLPILFILECIIRLLRHYYKSTLDTLKYFIMIEIDYFRDSRDSYQKLLDNHIDEKSPENEIKELGKKETDEEYLSRKVLGSRVQYGMALKHLRKLEKLYCILKK